MNQKELNELRRRFKPDRTAISKVYGCYVSSSRQIISYVDAPLGLLSQEEQEMYLNLLKKTLSGALGRNLIDIVFSTAQVADSDEHRLLQTLRQTEFRDPDKAHRLMSYLSDGSNLLEIPMEQLGGENEVRVLIGPENVAEELRDSSVVLATYDAGENMRGLIGVVGPTRMDYSKVAAKLSFIAAGLSKLLGGGTLPPPGLDNKLIIKGDDSDEHENK